MTGTRSVRTFPLDDVAFRAHVEAAAERHGGWDPAAVETSIRKAYPAAVVKRASELAQLGHESETWYVYRDGAVRAVDAQSWWLDVSLPTTVMELTGQYIDANEAAARLFGRSTSEIVAGRAGDFTRHEQTPEVTRELFRRLADTGVLHSTAVVVRPGGAEVPIEYHTRREGETYITVMRPISDRSTG